MSEKTSYLKTMYSKRDSCKLRYHRSHETTAEQMLGHSTLAFFVSNIWHGSKLIHQYPYSLSVAKGLFIRVRAAVNRMHKTCLVWIKIKSWREGTALPFHGQLEPLPLTFPVLNLLISDSIWRSSRKVFWCKQNGMLRFSKPEMNSIVTKSINF